jgi:hypothetical protein
MPNHFHGIIIIDNSVGASLCGRPNLINGYNEHKNQTSIIEYISSITNIDNRYVGHCPQGRASVGDRTYASLQQRPAPTHSNLSLGEIVGRFKSYTTTQYIAGVEKYEWKPFYEKLWQRGYYERIIRNKKELFAIRKYIINNPLNWKSAPIKSFPSASKTPSYGINKSG